jgi:uncharacterized membrane protein YkvI
MAFGLTGKSNLLAGRSVSFVFFGLIITASIGYTQYRKKMLEKVFDQPEFDVQLIAYTKVYRVTMAWHLFSAMLSCLYAILSYRSNFLLFAFVDLLVMLQFYPTQRLFRRELRNQEVIVHS